MKETTRGRSPSFPQKVEIGQPNLPSILERIKSLTSTESRKVPIYCKHTVCSILYARDPIIRPSFDKAEPPRRSLDKLVSHSRVVSTKSKSNGKNVTSLYMKTTGPTKHKEVGKPPPTLKSMNFVNTIEKHVNCKKQTRQPSKGLESNFVIVEKKPRFSDGHTSSNEGHNILTHKEDDKTIPIVNYDIPQLEYDNNQHMDVEGRDLLHCEAEYEDGDKIPLSEPLVHIGVRGFQDMLESNSCSQEYVAINETVNIKHIHDHDVKINCQDQVDQTFDVANDHDPCLKVDHDEENEEVVKEVDIVSKDVEHIESNDLEHEERKPVELEYEEPKPKRPGIKERGEEIPQKKDSTSKVVNENQQVVAYGKKDSATCNRVIDETLNKLREQRRNRVKALVGAFENVISH